MANDFDSLTDLGGKFRIGAVITGHDGTTYRIAKVDENGNLLVAAALDLSADIEVMGIELTQRAAEKSASGDNTLISPSSGNKLQVFRCDFSPSADISGTVIIKLGSTEIHRVRNPKEGYIYGLSLNPHYIVGGADETLVLNLPSATACDANWAIVETS